MTARHRPAPLGAILPAVVGDLVHLPGFLRHYAVRRCEAENTAGMHYACLSCRQLLANSAQLYFHLEAGGAHVIARECRDHGWEAL